MDAATRTTLAAVNHRFYRARAREFSATRQRPWPGWERALRGLEGGSVLDAGCGNGRLALALAAHAPRPRAYLGLDASAPLVREARARLADHDWAHFAEADLTDDRIAARVRAVGGEAAERGYDRVALFGVLHHVPDFARRRGLIVGLTPCLAPGGRLVFSLWRFAERARRRRRIVPWSDSGLALDPAQLEPGDHLLRWGTGDAPPRYCHEVDDAELAALVAGLPLRECDRFAADGGARGGESNVYVVLEHEARDG